MPVCCYLSSAIVYFVQEILVEFNSTTQQMIDVSFFSQVFDGHGGTDRMFCSEEHTKVHN